MLFVYSVIMYLLTPYLLLRLWWKGRRLPAYRKRILERFCLNKQPQTAVDLWVHAVSLGEVIAAIPLIDAFLEKQWTVLVTTITPTGSAQVRARFGDMVIHQYLPYDLSFALKRFFSLYKPRLGVILETELWPNLIHQAHAMKVPVLLINARLSERSLVGYLRVKWLFKPILNQLTAILAQSNEDAQRYMTLGASKNLIQVLGNMKFDLQINRIDSKQFLQLKDHWGKDRSVFIAASTHDDEESQIFKHLRRLQSAIPQVILLIAPRHPERFQTVYHLSIQAGFKTGLRTQLGSFSKETEVIVLDSLGELLGFFQVSDYAFVGGSLVPVGGHNVLEPIAMNVPVVSGDYIDNFKTICNSLTQNQAIQLVHTADELMDVLIKLDKDKALLNQMTQNASLVLKSNQGSVKRHLQYIERILSPEASSCV